MALAVTDRLDLIRLFLRVAETGQISEAARTLGLSQPTASRFLKRLEALLGAQLVDRSPHGLSLTQAGQDFLLPARRLAEGWHDAVDALKAEQTDISGTLRVAVPIAIGQGFLAVIAARFLQAHPHMAIDWHLRDDAVDVTGRGYDLWIRAGKVHRDDLVVRHIYRVERAIATAARGAEITHPRALQSMPAVRLSTFVPGTIALTGQGGEVFHLRQRTAFTTDNLYAALTAVLEGVGYGILPLWCLHKHLSNEALVRACRLWAVPPITLSLAYAPSRSRSPRVAAFIDHVRRALQDESGLGVAFIRETGSAETVLRL